MIDMSRRIILIILMLGALGYAVYTYAPIVAPYIAGMAAKKPAEVEVKKEVPAAVPSAVTTTTVAAEKKKAQPPAPKAVEVKKAVVDPFALRIAVKSVKEVEEARARAAERSKEEVKKPAEPELEGIWIGSGLKAAFISGQVLTEGGTIMGWRVIKINQNNVVLRKGRASKVLKLGGD